MVKWPSKNEEEGVKLPPLKKTNKRFSDIAGLHDLKETLREEVIYPISHPELSKLYKQRTGSGVLLYGPPGCGKTYIVKALAGEIGWPFIDASCGHMIARYAGQTENNIHEVFEKARAYVKYQSSGIILFLDEIDALGHRRDNLSSGEAGYRMIVTTLLSELDGISSNDKVFVVGATNAPWSVDPALKRPGRFDVCVFVPHPDTETRIELLKLYTKGLPLSKEVDFASLADRTKGYSSADIRELCDAAAEVPWKEAIKDRKLRRIDMCDFDKALTKTKSSIIEWYEMIRKNKLDEVNQHIAPQLSSSTKKFFEIVQPPEGKDLKGYG